MLDFPGFPIRSRTSSPTGSACRRRPRSRRRAPLRFGFETLETRVVPSTITWINPLGGDWDTASNWSGGVLPGPLDNAVINYPGITITHNLNTTDEVGSLTSKAAIALSAGTLKLDGPSTITNALSIAGGALSGAGSVKLNSLIWTIGTMTGPGSTTIVAGGTMTLRANGSRTLDGRTLNNAGAATWSGSGNLVLANGAALNNLAGGTFQAMGNASIVSGAGAAPSFTNAGTFRKTTLAGTTTIAVPFTNTGASSVEIGSLWFSADVTLGGSMALASGSAVTFYCDRVALNAGAITGAGMTSITNNATVTVSGSASVSNVTMDSGTITGPGTVSITNLTWTGGTMSGPGTTVALGTLAISGYEQVLTQRTLRNSGVATFADTPNGPYSYYPGLFFVSGGTLVNEPGASFAITTDCSIYGYVGSPSGGTITNYGVFSKTGGPGTSEVGVAYSYSSPVVFNQAGAGRVEVASGKLVFDGGGTLGGTGTLVADPNTTLGFGGGTFAVTATSGISGAGKVEFRAGTVTIDGTYGVTGTTLIDGGTAAFDAAASSASAAISDGTLTGPGTVSITNLTWTGGTMSGVGVTVVQGTLAISGYEQVLTQRTLRNSGVATFADTPNGPYSYYPGLFFVSGGTLVNEPGASFAITTDCSIYGYVGSPSGGTITNYGVFSKTGGPGTSEVGVAYSYSSPVVFNQAGAGRVEVASGKLVFDGGGTLGGTGTLVADPNTTLGFGGGTFQVAATSGIAGAGDVEFRAGTVTIDGTYGVTGTTLIDGGTAAFDGDASSASAAISVGVLTGPGSFTVSNAMTWTGGTMSGPGTTVALGTLAISGYEQVLTQRTLRNSGVATFADTPNGPYSYYPGLFFVSGGTLVNEPGASFAITTDCSIYGYVGSPSGGTITNYGVFSKTGGPGTSEVGVAYSYSSPVVFNQAGAGRVEVASGKLVFDGGGTLGGTGTLVADPNTTLGFGGGTFAVTATSGISGAGKVEFRAGTVTIDGTYGVTGTTLIDGGTAAFDAAASSASAAISDGTLTGPGTVSITNLTWTGGTMSGVGVTVVQGTLAISGYEQVLTQRTLRNSGVATFADTPNGPYSYYPGLFFVSGGTLVNEPGASFAITTDCSIYGYVGSPSGGTITNYGVFSKTGGPGTSEVGVAYSYSSPVVFNQAGAGRVEVASGKLVFDGGGTLGGTGTLVADPNTTLGFGGGTFAVTATSGISGAGKVEFRAGTVTIDGTYGVTGTTLIDGGTAAFDAAASSASAAISDGTLTGPGTVSITNLTWTGGTMSGVGVTVVQGTLAISGYEQVSTQRTLRNSGVATFADTPNGPYSYYPGLFFVSGGTLVNEPGASFAITTDCSIYGYVGSPSGGTITNYGVFSKTGGPGTSEVGVAYSYSSPVVFNQAGAGRVEVASGKLVFDGGGTLGGTGTLVADPNTTLGFGGGHVRRSPRPAGSPGPAMSSSARGP